MSEFDLDMARTDIYLLLISSCCSLFSQNAMHLHVLHTLLESYENLAAYFDAFKASSANVAHFNEIVECEVYKMLKKFEKKLCKEANSNYRQLQFEVIGQSCKLIQCFFDNLASHRMEFFGEKIVFSLKRLIHRMYEVKKTKKLEKMVNYALNRCFSLMNRIIRCNNSRFFFEFMELIDKKKRLVLKDEMIKADLKSVQYALYAGVEHQVSVFHSSFLTVF